MRLFFRIGSDTQVLDESGGKLGRAATCKIRVADMHVSSDHAEFSWDGQQWWIRPLADKNPVLRDGLPLPTAKVPLGRSGVLQFGPVQVQFWVEGAEPKVGVAAQKEWQRLRINIAPAELPPKNPPIHEISTQVLNPASAPPPTIVAPPRPVAPLAPPAPPIGARPYEPAPPVAEKAPVPAPGGQGDMLKQMGLVSGFLVLICTVGFCIGLWLLG